MKIPVLLSVLLFNTVLSAQSSNLLGSWEGVLQYYSSSEDPVKEQKVRIDIETADKASLYFFNESFGTYVPYTTDNRFKGFRTNLTVQATAPNNAVLTLFKENSSGAGSETYNICFLKETGSALVLWTNLEVPLKDDILFTASGQMFPSLGKSTVYAGNKLSVGGQSFNYISVKSVTVGEKETLVTFFISNNTGKELSGTFHEPVSATAFYITNADRSKKYKLIGSYSALPYSFKLPAGNSTEITLRFEKIPSDMKMINLFEGGSPDATNLWKFYDVRLKD